MLLIAFALACGSDPTEEPDGGTSDDGGTTDPDPRFGEAAIAFSITEVIGSDGASRFETSTVNGVSYENEPPQFHRVAMQAGSCRLLTYESPSCGGICDGVCTDTDVCTPFPTFASVGNVSISGLKFDGALTEFDGRYGPAETLPTDLFDVGDQIALTATGDGDVPGFSLAARGVQRLDDAIGLRLTISDDEDTVVSWQSGAGADRARLILRGTNDAHGLPLRAIIECDGSDTGLFTVPRELAARLPVSNGDGICASFDCPASELIRYRLDEVTLGGRTAELVVASSLQFPLVHNPLE